MKIKSKPPKGMALITGASSGIGLAYCREFASRGYDLVMVSNRQDELEAAARAIETEYGHKAIGKFMDLATTHAAKNLYDFCQSEQLDIEILINNAGIFFFDDVCGVADRKIETMSLLHVYTPAMLCHYFGKSMIRRGGGYIINMASIAANLPFPGITLYAATKSFLRTFTKSLNIELHNDNVSVTAVCPGAVATDLYQLNAKYQKLGIRLGILMTPQRLVKKAIRAMYKGKRNVVPGLLTRTFVILPYLIPPRLVAYLKRNMKLYKYGR